MKTRLVIRTTLIIALAAMTAGMFFLPPQAAADQMRLTGSGASFPYPLYSTWFQMYQKQNKNTLINYQAKGSGAGIKDLINKTVDFAASDAAMSDDEIAKVESGVIMLPMTAGSIVLAYNLPGNPKSIKLSREVYPKIFLAEITKWNDPQIAKDNPDVKLPDMDITVVRRSDSSGTTYVFTKHLSEISEAWKNGPGTGKTVNWPDSDKIVAAPKNDGITATIRQTPGAIGYIEFGYAKLTKMPMAALQNRTGKFVEPTAESGAAALATAELPPDMRVWLPDPEGEGSYPIATYTWMLFYGKYENPETAKALRSVVEWCLNEGQKVSDKMGYIPLPDNVVAAVRIAAADIQ
jgi:phosphate transport system substrate-binding protein